MNEIVVGIDGSTTAHRAAVRAAELAMKFDRPLHLVMAVSMTVYADMGAGVAPMLNDAIAAAGATVQAAETEFAYAGVVTSAVVARDPASALCDEAERLGASIIVVGNKRVQGISRVLGSIAGGVAKMAPCDVYIVHTF